MLIYSLDKAARDAILESASLWVMSCTVAIGQGCAGLELQRCLKQLKYYGVITKKRLFGILGLGKKLPIFMISSFLAQIVQRNISVASKASNVTSASTVCVRRCITRHSGTQQPPECCSAWLGAIGIW